jgi:hypothetical protein
MIQNSDAKWTYQAYYIVMLEKILEKLPGSEKSVGAAYGSYGFDTNW